MTTSVSVHDRILDISVNLARIGTWTADGYEEKKQLIQRFIEQTDSYIVEVTAQPLKKDLEQPFNRFQKMFKELQISTITAENKDIWAEKILTWANILQHRAVLA